jgi:FMN phosphatase YigB (HAD superfamily)
VAGRIPKIIIYIRNRARYSRDTRTAKDRYNGGMIKAIIFDADGPLYYRTSEITQKKQSLLAGFGYHGDIKRFEDAYEKEKFKGYVGAETAEEMFKNILRDIDLVVSSENAILFTKKIDVVHRQVTAAAGAVAVLRRLKNEGYKTCVLTDSFYSSEEKWSWFKALGMDEYLDYMVSSYDIRKLKDSPEAYQACLDLLEVSAAEAVFVGHQEYEMAGARASKIISVAVTPIASLGIHADNKINSLSELSDLLKEINGST